MAIDPTTRLRVEAELRLGKKPKELADKYEVPYVTVNGWNNKLKKVLLDQSVDDVMNYDEVTLQTVLDKASEEMPLPEAKKVEKLTKDIVGLQRLEEKTREIGFSILNQVQAYMALNNCELKELSQAANIVTTLHNSLFNKANTQINVMNNNTTNISSEKREIFRNSLKA
jgi:hypothetical protein